MLAGGADNDSISGGIIADTTNGGTGNDSIQGNAGADQLSGGDNDDQFVYTATADLFSGNALVDIVNGDGGIDSIAINNNDTGNFGITDGNSWATRNSGIESIRAYAASKAEIWIELHNNAYEDGGLRSIDLSADTNAAAINILNVSAETTAGNGYTLTGSAGKDIARGGAGSDSICGGGANDSITGNGGADQLTGGAGANDFIMANAVVGGAVNQDIITDFVVDNTDQIGKYSITNLEGLGILTDLVEVTATTTSASAEAITVSGAADISGAYDMDSAGGNANVLLITGNYTTAGDVETDFRANVTNGTTAIEAGDGILCAYDTGANTRIALVTFAGAKNAAAALNNAVVTDITELTGVADATTLANGNWLAFT